MTDAVRHGPSGQVLRGATQKTQIVEGIPPAGANPLQTPAVEAEHVHKVYNAIAAHWDSTRYKAWPRVDEFVRQQPSRSLIADLGCGNGKNIPAALESGSTVIAADMSLPLVQIAVAHNGVDGLAGDCLCMPYRSGTFDAVLSIAVLHHLSTVSRRVQALREAARLLRPGGEFLVYCWSFEQDAELSRSRHRFDAQDVLVSWSHREPYVKKAARGKDAQCDCRGTWEDDSALRRYRQVWGPTEDFEVYQRYCHVYRAGELEELLQQVPELEVLEIYFDTGNWCGRTRKK